MPEHITMYVNHLVDGGAARVAVNLAGAWTDMGRKVTILTSDAGEIPPIYPLPPGVVHLPLGLWADSRNPLDAAWRNLTRVVRIRRAVRRSRPDLLVSFLDRNNIMCVLAARTLLPRIPVIISERTDPHGRSIGTWWELLRRLTYPFADCLVVQTRRAQTFFPGLIRSRCVVIPNPVYPPLDTGTPEQRSRFRVVTLGRNHPVKGHDLLIDAFALVAEAFPDWDLCIHGDGPDRDALAERIRRHRLEGRIQLGENLADVGDCLRNADLFVLPSRVEGFPNALAEAMAWGLPVVSFDCNSGPGELIRHDLDGLLVPPGDVPALAAAMGRLMANPAERQRLAARAPEVLSRFSPARIMELWESAIQSANRTLKKGA